MKTNAIFKIPLHYYLLPSIMIFEREEGVKKGLFERGNFKWRHSTSLYVILKNFEIDADM